MRAMLLNRIQPASSCGGMKLGTMEPAHAHAEQKIIVRVNRYGLWIWLLTPHTPLHIDSPRHPDSSAEMSSLCAQRLSARTVPGKFCVCPVASHARRFTDALSTATDALSCCLCVRVRSPQARGRGARRDPCGACGPQEGRDRPQARQHGEPAHGQRDNCSGGWRFARAALRWCAR